ncbi:hypothetical protein LUZ60_002346 [Juncus effusus]|nr:hypothetical protein LUZ60_002346 [Juncus effusus]
MEIGGDRVEKEIEVKNEEGEEEKENECILEFLDSLDDYLKLVDSLSSNLRQGWFDLASARQSMGISRVSSRLFDHTVHSASTTVQFTQTDSNPQFNLSKWAKTEENDYEEDQNVKNNANLRQRGLSEGSKEVQSDITNNNEMQKERSKSLAVFGKLVSPKLRTAQVSFETGLERIVEIANARAKMLSSFERLQQKTKG